MRRKYLKSYASSHVVFGTIILVIANNYPQPKCTIAPKSVGF